MATVDSIANDHLQRPGGDDQHDAVDDAARRRQRSRSQDHRRQFRHVPELLTTQLKNQNPLDPLDTNQFTQQLVQFAQVEQQIKQNQQLETLISIEKSAQADHRARLRRLDRCDRRPDRGADQQPGHLDVQRAEAGRRATVTIKNATGQTVYNGSFSMNTGTQTFEWDGRDDNGVQWPDGNYTISVTGKDTSGQTVAIASEIEGVVDSVDLTKTPPELKVGGQAFTLDKIKRVVRPRV